MKLSTKYEFTVGKYRFLSQVNLKEKRVYRQKKTKFYLFSKNLFLFIRFNSIFFLFCLSVDRKDKKETKLAENLVDI